MRRHGRKLLVASLLAGVAAAAGARHLRPGTLLGKTGDAAPGWSVPATPGEVVETIYDGGLKPGWQDWGWGAHDLSAGPAKINLSQYGGWIVHKDNLAPRFGALVFRMQVPKNFGDFLQIKLSYNNDGNAFPAVDVPSDHMRSLPGGWVEVAVPWSVLDPSSTPANSITIHAKTQVGSDWVKFDKVVLTKFDAKAALSAAANAPARDAKLVVDCKAPSHTISPYIYGVAGAGDPWALGPTAHRWGGNPTTRYNFQIDALNVGKDWFFENGAAGSYRSFLDENRARNAISALTLPMIGWVAKDKTSSGFPVSVFGPQHATDQWRGDAGDGLSKDGSPIRPGPPTQTSVPASPAFMRQWVDAIQSADQRTGARSVQMYILDNEPNLWNSNHRDVHPNPLTYDEILDRTVQYGSMIRGADPRAVIAGPAEWGWTGYFYSAADVAAGIRVAPDRRAHGDVPFVEWYLKKLHEYELSHKVKLLDVFDLHFYPQGQGVYGSAADPKTAALRLRSTRALWDASYVDESWINDTVRLLPRMKEWIQRDYPGLAISIGEYNFGGEQHMSGALALAEALGRFGEAGIAYAFYWTFPPKNSPAYWAFRAFRNFDAKGGHFLDRSVTAHADQNVSFYVSRDETGKHLVAIALNFDPNESARAKIAFDGCGTVLSRRAFVYGPATESLTDEGTKSGATFDELLPAYSINVFDIAVQ